MIGQVHSARTPGACRPSLASAEGKATSQHKPRFPFFTCVLSLTSAAMCRGATKRLRLQRGSNGAVRAAGAWLGDGETVEVEELEVVVPRGARPGTRLAFPGG